MDWEVVIYRLLQRTVWVQQAANELLFQSTFHDGTISADFNLKYFSFYERFLLISDHHKIGQSKIDWPCSRVIPQKIRADHPTRSAPLFRQVPLL